MKKIEVISKKNPDLKIKTNACFVVEIYNKKELITRHVLLSGDNFCLSDLFIGNEVIIKALRHER